jgi:hypothetical protein
MAFMKRIPAVKLNSGFSGIESNGEWIWSGPFRIHIQSGKVAAEGLHGPKQTGICCLLT